MLLELNDGDEWMNRHDQPTTHSFHELHAKNIQQLCLNVFNEGLSFPGTLCERAHMHTSIWTQMHRIIISSNTQDLLFKDKVCVSLMRHWNVLTFQCTVSNKSNFVIMHQQTPCWSTGIPLMMSCFGAYVSP
jgi:hypothetical protein